MSNGTAGDNEFADGDKELYNSQLEKFKALQSWLASNGANYGFASSLDEVDEAARESLLEADLTTLDGPTPLLLPRESVKNELINKIVARQQVWATTHAQTTAMIKALAQLKEDVGFTTSDEELLGFMSSDEESEMEL
ncbi:hypothetical protein MNV49_002122 [Pseudohyphozyma bogoriensis]|nr:hypothetical protein MNV49_002122 [Pseudohyphozyma bogoriensis]